MRRRFLWSLVLLMLGSGWAQIAAPTVRPPTPSPPRAWTWEQVQDRLALNNPTLLAGKLNISELQAQEITAHFRPNPQLTLLADQIDPFPGGPAHGPFAYLLPSATVSYLHERAHKRELRTESAQKATAIGVSQEQDLERNLLFSLRGAFVQILQAKAVLQLAKDNLEYYDHVLKISRDRFQAGDIAQIDLDRLELQRVQYESDLQSADVNLRTQKIQLLTLLNDRTPVEQFDVAGVIRFQRSDRGPGFLQADRAGHAAGLESSRAVGRDGADQLQAGGSERIDRSNVQLRCRRGILRLTPYIGLGVEYSPARFRPQPGREAAHQDRHHAQRAAARRGPGTGIQRRGFRLCGGEQQRHSVAALPGAISATGRARARHDFLFLSAWRRIAARLHQRAE